MKADLKTTLLGGGLFLGPALVLAAVVAQALGWGSVFVGAGSNGIPGAEVAAWWPALLATAAFGIWVFLGHGQRSAVAVAALWLAVALLDLALNGRVVLLGPALVALVLATLRFREWASSGG